MGCLVVLSLLCKPSYVLAFLPVLCGSIFVNNIKLGHYWSAFTKQIPIAIIALPIMAYQYHVTFTSAPAMQKTIIAPFLVMNAYSPHIGISLLLSFMFPLMMFLFYYDKFDRYVVMAWLVSLSALMLFLLLAESPNFQAGNYCWGCIAANYILFLFSVRLLLNQPSNLKALVCYAVLGLHFLSGLFLLTSFFVSQTSLII